MSNGILVLQKVTTYPIETIKFPTLLNIENDEIHKYYSRQILLDPPVRPKPVGDQVPSHCPIPGVPVPPPTTATPIRIGTVLDVEMTKENFEKIDYEKKKEKENVTYNATKDIDKKDLIKKRFIIYNSIFDKLLANSLNLLERDPNDITTLVVFPIYDQLDNGRIELKSTAKEFYNDKFENITRQTIIIKKNIGYYGLPVFRNETNDEYKKSIKEEFDDMKRLIIEFNNDVIKKTTFGRSETNNLKQIKQILFIIDIDKKSLFTGFYNKALGKEKEEILNKEYYNFLSSSGFRRKNVDDAGINLLYKNVEKEMDRFKIATGVGITKELTEDDFNDFISKLRDEYKKNTDAQYKKSIELKDNIKVFKIYYKLDLADKIIEDKIETGPNKLYYIYLDRQKDRKQHVIGHFTVNSEERQIYRFQEEKSTYKRRMNMKPENDVILEGKTPTNGITDTKILPSNLLDFAVQISLNYGTFTYKNLDESIKFVGIKSGTITPYRDKKEKKYKWFNIRDIDESLLNKDTIKYYSDILFDKKTLIEYLKSKEKYTNKTRLSYEFLKINDSPELSNYCDFIYKNFKSNINSLKRGFFGFDPFTIKFNDDVIMKNIMDIIFESNALIYVQKNRIIKEEARKESRDAYKIVKYRMDETFDDETCKKYTDIFLSNDDYKTEIKKNNINECLTVYKKEQERVSVKSVIIVVSKINIKDVELLKSTVECKTKANKLKYDYRQLYSNITKRIGIVGGTKKKKYKKNITKNIKINSKRRLKAKRYK
jgi:hypothetical protein